MNVNEYAQRILFSDDLEEKLRLSSDTIEFDFQQVKIGAKIKPGRPASLLFDQQRPDVVSRFSLPSTPSLVDDRKRGQLLHFFANHELLAAELMALALLKFPDAPEPFRRGLFETMVEEQKHTLWYLGRMKECGVSLGEYPVSGFFWNTVSTMAEPIDYVSRLSLTFEQANLDYSRHFGAIMEQVGDSRTARIMNKIYQDEINHVNYGLEWFRKWKPAHQSDWQAYQDRLTLPISPSRAKGGGTHFNVEGRLAAGLDEAFVRQLAVFEKSKGRSPNLFYFNPDAEDQIAAHLRGEVYSPSAKVCSLVEDLEILQVFLARKDDVILMRKPPSLEHLERLQRAGFQLPEIHSSKQTMVADSRNIRQIQPWSATPNLVPEFADVQRIEQTALWQDDWAELFSKAKLKQHLGAWAEHSTVISNSQQLQQVSSKVSTNQGVVLKQPISAAGRGVRFVKHPERFSVDRPWVVEPWHNRVFDFSVQFQVSAQGLKQVGLIRQKIDPKSGRYLGSISSPKFCKGLSPELSQFLMQNALPNYNENSEFCQALWNWIRSVNYIGPLGVDSYLYTDPDSPGQLQHRVVCEINPRFTMGRVSHEIRRQIAPGHSVLFSIDKANKTVEESTTLNKARLAQGTLTLNEIHPETFFAATIVVNKNPNLL